MRLYRNIFICAAIIGAMVGCVKNDLDVEIGESDQIITLSTSVEATRASVTESLSDNFKLSAFKYSTGYPYYADDVYYNKDGEWTSGITRYWPSYDNLDFFAYSPMDKTFIAEELIVDKDKTDRDNFSLRYTCPADIDEQVDLLVATSSNQTADDGDVELLFLHALSGIKFNVEFEESNVELQTLNINYIGIENERVYNFATESWGESLGKYFDSTSGYSTSINPTNETGATFELDDCLMIIPQPIDVKDQFISIQIEYALIGAQDNTKTDVITGTMPLPAPTDDNVYAQGYIYTYNIIVSGKTISFSTIDSSATITDQEAPIAAYGNIDLSLITERSTADEIGYYPVSETDSDTDSGTETDDGSQYYYTTAERVKNLLLDGVRDFVVVGSLGAHETDEDGNVNHLGNGKLGYYGSESSAFTIGARLAEAESGDSYLFSVDLRETYDYPEFQYANTEGSDGSGSTSSISSDIKDTDPIMIAGLFSEVRRLKEVMLPNGIMAIGTHAFEECVNLTTIDIADVKHIEEGAFQNSSALVTVEYGALTRIHDNGFDDCTALTTIDLSSVTQVDQYGFVNCSSLTNVDLSSLSVIGVSAFNGCTNLTLQQDTSIPAFTSVANYAFSKCSKLDSYIDLTGATEVGKHAFNECTEIKLAIETKDTDNIINMDVLETVGAYAFTDCEHIGSEYEISMATLNSVDTAAFKGCIKLNIIDGLQNLTNISTSAFEDCSSLTGYSSTATDKVLSLPNVTVVESLGFADATGLTNVAFNGDVLETIGSNAFDGCTSLTTISGLEGVTSVGTYAFASCTSLENLELPALTDGKWGANFFSSCSSLKKVSLPLLTIESITYTNSSGDAATSSIISMIGNCTAIEEIDCENLSGEISSNAFSGCTALTTLNLPNVTGSYGSWGMLNSSSLKYIDLSSISSLAAGTFQGSNANTALEEIYLTSATSIGEQAFKDCTALRVAIIPAATTIEKYTFSGCINLRVLDLRGLTSYDSSYWAFSDATENCTLILSDAEYENVSGTSWGGYGSWGKIIKASDITDTDLDTLIAEALAAD